MLPGLYDSVTSFTQVSENGSLGYVKEIEKQPARHLFIRSVEMSAEQQNLAISCGLKGIRMFSIERDIAEYIKKTFDEKYRPAWQCIVGRNFGSHINHDPNNFIFYELGELYVLLFRCLTY